MTATLAPLDKHIEIIRVDAARDSGNGAIHLGDDKGVLAERYDLRESAVYLIRPDQHVAARWRKLDAGKIARALQRAIGAELQPEQAA